MPKKSIIAIGAVVVLAVAVAVLPAFIRVRTVPAKAQCINNLRQLDGAKQQWELEERKTTNDIPTMGELRLYLKQTLVCPEGGNYVPGRVGEPPRCSIGGPSHTLPQ